MRMGKKALCYGFIYKLKHSLHHSYYLSALELPNWTLLPSQAEWCPLKLFRHSFWCSTMLCSGPGPALDLNIGHTYFDDITIAFFPDDTAVLSVNESPATTSDKSQSGFNRVSMWLKQLKINVKRVKSTHVNLIINKQSCSPAHLDNIVNPHTDQVRNKGVYTLSFG